MKKLIELSVSTPATSHPHVFFHTLPVGGEDFLIMTEYRYEDHSLFVNTAVTNYGLWEPLTLYEVECIIEESEWEEVL